MVSVDVIFIEDPACSWCWAFQPVTTAFAFEYRGALASGRLRARHVMGGLRDRCVEDTEFVMYQWRKAASVSGMPFADGIWRRHVLRTTFVACRAVKAAGLIHSVAAHHLLRRLREAFHVEEIPIDCEDTVVRLADELGLEDRYGLDGKTLRDYIDGGRADALFERDRCEAAGVGFGFPTVVVKTFHQEEPRILNGTVPYADLVAALAALGVSSSERQRFRDTDEDWRALFEVHPRLTPVEIEDVTGYDIARAASRLAPLGVTQSGSFLCWPTACGATCGTTYGSAERDGARGKNESNVLAPARTTTRGADAGSTSTLPAAATANTATAPGPGAAPAMDGDAREARQHAPAARGTAKRSRRRPTSGERSKPPRAPAARRSTQPSSPMPPEGAFEFRLRDAPSSSSSPSSK